jgi:hypothetical protein
MRLAYEARERNLQVLCCQSASNGKLNERALVNFICGPQEPFYTLPVLAARHLPGGGIEAVEKVGRGDHEDQRRESLLVVVPGGLVIDLVWDRVGPVGKPSDGLGEREGGTFGVGEVGCLSPGRHGEEALVGFACLLGAACARVHTEATAIDLARAQVDKLKHSLRHATLSRGQE